MVLLGNFQLSIFFHADLLAFPWYRVGCGKTSSCYVNDRELIDMQVNGQKMITKRKFRNMLYFVLTSSVRS